MTTRRDFITLLGGAAAWPLAVRAQQGDRVRRIGVLMVFDENDPQGKLLYSAFTQALADMGWIDGRNVRMDLRWGGGDINRIRALAQELVGLQPDVILANSTAVTVALQRETRTIPIVFVGATEPVGRVVERLNQPGGNITGFAIYEASMGGKWLELLSEIAAGLKRAAFMFNPDSAPVSTYMPSFEAAALREAFWGEHANRLILVGYEALAKKPADTVKQLYAFLGEEWFAHDFDNIEFEANEFDIALGTPNLHTVRRRVE
jgi:putative ABC transport system substrate-binding protein